MALNIELFYIISRKLSLCGLFWTTLYTIMICMVLFNVHSRVSRKLYFLVLVLVIYSFTNVFPKQPATCTRCPSSWADRVWCAGRRASCCVLMSGRGRP